MDKVVPHDLQAEASALGAMILNGDKLDNAMSRLKGSDFFRPAHSAIFHAIMQLHTDGKPIDLVTLKSQLVKNKAYEKVGGQDYLVELCEGCPSISSLDHYVDVVIEKSVSRQVIAGCDRLGAKAYGEAFAVREQTNKLIEWGVKLRQKLEGGQAKEVDFSDIAPEVISDMQKPCKGISTGFAAIDKEIIGLIPGRMITLGGYPGDGKTALALNIAYNVIRNRNKCMYFSAEMGVQELAQRIICSDSETFLTKAIKGTAQDIDIQRMTGYEQYRGRFTLIDNILTTSLIESRLRQEYTKSDPIRLVVVDYVQLMDGDGRSRYEKYTNISTQLKNIARKYEVTVLLLSQFNRPFSPQQMDLPTKFNLKETGSLENDSDVVLLLGRDYENDKLLDDEVHKSGPLSAYKERWLKVDKCRYGPVTPWPSAEHDEGIRLKFYPGITRFGQW